MKTAIILAKGPSLQHVDSFIEPSDHVAAINDAASVLDRDVIEYVFFSDVLVCAKVESYQHKVQRFIGREPRDQEFSQYPDWIYPKWTYYRWCECCGDRESLHKRILDGGICHHHSTPAAIHWLCKFGKYDRIKIIGVDGGKDYHKDLTRLYEGFVAPLNEWKLITQRLADICHRVYGTEFIWFDESNHSGKSQQQ